MIEPLGEGMKHCKEVEVCQYSDNESSGQPYCSKEDVCKYFLKADKLQLAVEALTKISKVCVDFNYPDYWFKESEAKREIAKQCLDRLAEETVCHCAVGTFWSSKYCSNCGGVAATGQKQMNEEVK